MNSPAAARRTIEGIRRVIWSGGFDLREDPPVRRRLRSEGDAAMLNRVALDREQRFADVLLDFVPDLDTSWPDLVEVNASAASICVRLRLHVDELEVLAVALDSAVTGGEGELYFRLSETPK
jgi:hypothetical protein